jgi:hypothetical protein
MNEYSTIFLYLFSSFVQSDAALLAIFGLFSVFRLQSLDTDYQRNWDIITSVFPTDLAEAQRSIILANSSEGREAALAKLEGTQFESVANRLVRIPLARNSIKTGLKVPTALLSAHLLSCSLGLVFSASLGNLGAVGFYLVALLAVAPVIIAVLLMIRSVSAMLTRTVTELIPS